MGVSGYLPCLKDVNNPSQCLGGARVTIVADGDGAALKITRISLEVGRALPAWVGVEVRTMA